MPALKRLRPHPGPFGLLEVLKAGLPAACAIFDPRGTPLWVSARAERELGLRIARNGATTLVERTPELARWIEAAQQATQQPRQFDGIVVERLQLSDGSSMVLATRHEGGFGARALDLSARTWRLTERETEVLRHLAAGRSNKAIAATLACSLRTVEVHVSAIFQKSDCRSRLELVARVWNRAL